MRCTDDAEPIINEQKESAWGTGKVEGIHFTFVIYKFVPSKSTLLDNLSLNRFIIKLINAFISLL